MLLIMFILIISFLYIMVFRVNKGEPNPESSEVINFRADRVKRDNKQEVCQSFE